MAVKTQKGMPKKNNKYSSLGETFKSYRPEYLTWCNLRYRCTNPNNDMYEYYGGRGIKVCDRWLGKDGFKNFYLDMGPRPSSANGEKYQIDRIDSNGDYSPNNCRWATLMQNSHNKRNNIYVYIYGDKYCVAEACRMFGVNRTTVTESVRLRGKTADEAFASALERRKK